MAGRRRRAAQVPAGESAIAGANIRILRQRKGWSQAQLGELMGWPTTSTVCAAEGRRGGRQRGFTTDEVRRLSVIFGISPRKLTTHCANCEGHPPAGFACLTCGATYNGEQFSKGDEHKHTDPRGNHEQ
jgi:transcriptional regulator with XRE-family HTH domain